MEVRVVLDWAGSEVALEALAWAQVWVVAMVECRNNPSCCCTW